MYNCVQRHLGICWYCMIGHLTCYDRLPNAYGHSGHLLYGLWGCLIPNLLVSPPSISIDPGILGYAQDAHIGYAAFGSELLQWQLLQLNAIAFNSCRALMTYGSYHGPW